MASEKHKNSQDTKAVEDRILQTTLEAYGARILAVPGDGDCLFASLALAGTNADMKREGNVQCVEASQLQEKALATRLQVVEHMEAHRQDWELLVSGRSATLDRMVSSEVGETFDDYCARMRGAGEFGDAECLTAAAKALGAPVRLHGVFYDKATNSASAHCQEYGCVRADPNPDAAAGMLLVCVCVPTSNMHVPGCTCPHTGS